MNFSNAKTVLISEDINFTKSFWVVYKLNGNPNFGFKLQSIIKFSQSNLIIAVIRFCRKPD